MSTHALPPDSRSPTIEASSPRPDPRPTDLDENIQPLNLNHAVRTRRRDKPTGAAAKSLDSMRERIEELLQDPWRKDFVNTSNHLMRLGNKNVKMVKPRRQKVRDIVANNLHVVKLYNEYAAKQWVAEKRVTYRLPIFADLEEVDGGGPVEQRGGAMGSEQRDGGDGEEQQIGGEIELQDGGEVELQNGGETGQQDGGEIGMQDGGDRDEQHNAGDVEEQQSGSEGMEQQNGGEIHDEQLDATDTEETLPNAAVYEPNAAGAEMLALMKEQTEEELDKEMEVAEANMIDNVRQSILHPFPEDATDTDTEMMSIDVLPRLEAPVAQRRHVHFAPEVTLSQEQPSAAVEPMPDVVFDSPPQKNPIQAVKLPARVPQPLRPKLTRMQVTPVTNPEAFPIERVQVVQAQYYPSAKIVNVLTQRDPSGEVIRVTADMQDGPVNHFSIHDTRIITALGLLEGDGDKINVNEAVLKVHETFIINVLPHQRVENLNNFVVGELQSARHAYLHWLDYRKCADPRCPPFVQEARTIAVRLRRRAHDVWREIDAYWQLEQGSGGIQYRNNRLKNLGEDVHYERNACEKEKRALSSMWV